MGTFIAGKCPRCGYHDKIAAGNGLRDCQPAAALSAARNDEGLKAALEANMQFKIERFATICIACRRMVAAEEVTYQTPDGEGHVVPGVCPHCGGRVRHGTGEVPCPLCGYPMELKSAGHWD